MDIFNEMASPYDEGADVQLNNVGDLLMLDGADLARQQLMRRLLTNPGEYYWYPTFGVGIRKEIGKLATLEEIRRLEARCVEQVSSIPTISTVPPPIVKITQPNYSQLSIQIEYKEKNTNVSRVFKMNVSK